MCIRSPSRCGERVPSHRTHRLGCLFVSTVREGRAPAAAAAHCRGHTVSSASSPLPHHCCCRILIASRCPRHSASRDSGSRSRTLPETMILLGQPQPLRSPGGVVGPHRACFSEPASQSEPQSIHTDGRGRPLREESPSLGWVSPSLHSKKQHLATMSRLAPNNPHRTPPPAEGGSVDSWSAMSHRVPVGAYQHHPSLTVGPRARRSRTETASPCRAGLDGGRRPPPRRGASHHTDRLGTAHTSHVRLDLGLERDFTCNAEAQAAWG